MLRREVELIRTALIPKEKVSDEEMAELLDIDAKMRRGERIRLDDAFTPQPSFSTPSQSA
jgi:hypothetical protein